jgi:hypothetical protein
VSGALRIINKKAAIMSEKSERSGMGWLPDYPDFRDLTIHHGKMVIRNANPGAFLIRNSWGTGWGDQGYGWLPYDYVLNGLAVDWWSLLKNEWVDTGNFNV